jgi:phosphate transport system substrate-binding protein
MNKKLLAIVIVAIVVVAASVVYSYSSRRETIEVSGAWALYPMMIKWTEEYQKIHPEIRFDVSAGGAGKGMLDALNGLVDIGMVSREIYPQEEEQGAFWVAVCKDAVVPTANADNPVLGDLLTHGIKKQVFLDIWISGTITTWGVVVGKPETTDTINIYTRSDACGAAETWAKYLGYKQEDLLGTAVYGDPGLAQAVKSDTSGIGYNNLNYAYDADTGEPIAGLVVIPLDLNENGQIDEEERFYDTKADLVNAIATGVYPSPPARDLNLVTKNEFTGMTKEFIKWILTDGQQYISETGYIPLAPEKIAEELNKLS